MVSYTVGKRKPKAKPKGMKPMRNKQILAIEPFPFGYLVTLKWEKVSKRPLGIWGKALKMKNSYQNK